MAPVLQLKWALLHGVLLLCCHEPTTTYPICQHPRNLNCCSSGVTLDLSCLQSGSQPCQNLGSGQLPLQRSLACATYLRLASATVATLSMALCYQKICLVLLFLQHTG